ncbi:endoribonuclease SymE [Pantoea sp. MBD-2R]|uniref:endoribonuclease SymE n=1 Tax=Pantoea sp. MBD-2R TaxID=3141540 RepID=UPI003182D359
MAEQDCSAETDLKEVPGHAARRIKVSYASTFPDYERIPSLIMKGKWLEAAGFTTGTAVDVRVMDGCLVITSRAPEPEEPELMKSLRQVCKLSARKQRQVQEFIGVVGGKRV